MSYTVCINQHFISYVVQVVATFSAGWLMWSLVINWLFGFPSKMRDLQTATYNWNNVKFSLWCSHLIYHTSATCCFFFVIVWRQTIPWMNTEHVSSGKTINSGSSVRRNILFTGTVKVKHKLPYDTFIHRVWKSYTKTKIFENMGFDMKYDPHIIISWKKVSVW